jgi:transposase
MDDIARFKMFCQLRRQIRGSGDHLIVGIDIAKEKHHAFFGTAKGQSLWRRLIFTNDLTGFRRLIEQVDTLKSTTEPKAKPPPGSRLLTPDFFIFL